MNYKDFPSLIEHLDRSFRLNMEQAWPHDEILGWWRDIPCKVTRYIKRSQDVDTTRPLYTMFNIILNGQVVASWGAETPMHEKMITKWFAEKRQAVITEQSLRRNDLERLFKHG